MAMLLSLIKTKTGVASLVWGMALFSLLSGCQSVIRPSVGQRPEMRSPAAGVTLSPDLPTVAIRPSTMIGGHALNPNARYLRESYYEKPLLLDVRALYSTMRDELTGQGYRTTTRTPASRWRVRSEVVSLLYNTFGSDPQKGWSEAQIVVDWKVYGPRRVTIRTVGHTTNRTHSMDVVSKAWKRAVRAFGGNPKVVTALRSDFSAGVARPAKPMPNGVSRVITATQPAGQALTYAPLKALLQPSVVWVKAGSRSGVGVILSNTGMLLTSLAVVEGVPSATVTDYLGRSVQARIVAFDPDAKVALLEAKLPTAQPAALLTAGSILGVPVVVVESADAGGATTLVRDGVITSAPPGEFDTNIVSEASSGLVFDQRGRLTGVVTSGRGGGSNGVQGITTSAALRALNIQVISR